jgi:MoxR-like ATPase
MSTHILHAKFATARKALSSALIEREDEIDLALTALLAGEHLLLVGPPGCGKSLGRDRSSTNPESSVNSA